MDYTQKLNNHKQRIVQEAQSITKLYEEFFIYCSDDELKKYYLMSEQEQNDFKEYIQNKIKREKKLKANLDNFFDESKTKNKDE